ncbi:T9SS type B sorting domain-containing protein [Flagellimonas zhangzhouensis]|uniref:Gliding motility-associated C-terminal domain-containing protein n=1 Tax=Flagellimonas zhangzhouensis TaxID=1073328 RepID=A0A1H2UV71_9FLAO|nr:T9SS type B sorting domain-containing protein [Allomuricauda zhangzhouensis]SDQ13733.1 gliding motility-associated C-terminal domain-containing protein [Allomuricauda zhangzhouensis]SDW59504.1 gliding motility-associated C-terminal domain-containing protein [Allomuricauda zhangzhouensis]
MRKQLLKWCIALCAILFSYTGYSQVKNSFDVRYENELRGDLTFIANNIVNRDEGGDDPEDPYNLTGSSSEYNDRLNMQYIDVDSDPSTFSSSSATLAIPDTGCSLIRYAGLYWSAVYSDSNRSTDFNQIKFQVPGASYVDLTADEILFDGQGDSDFGNYAPYACYKDVTSILTGLANPDGEYTVANVRASSGDNVQGGVSGGWTLVIVYENPTYPGKYITTFDGYAGIKSGQTVDIPFSGFTTLPAPFPVNAKLGVAALEGDNRISGDGLSIRADSNSTFTSLSNAANPATNFFNSNITDEGVIQTNRNPNSINTLGWDVDLFTIPNPSRSVIPNSETGATLRASSSQDKYDIFFTSLDVEIIEPHMNLAKTVEDIGGNDITGQGVNLGQYLDYVLTFQNVGNDDAINYTIRDILPINVTLDESSISMPAGVTYTYDPSTRTVLFTVPNGIIEENDPAATIRMRVQVAENCYDFIDACTDIIQNVAYSTYQGAINSAQITDDPSVSEFDGCGFGTPGATNFLLDDLSACNFDRTVQLCGDNVLLDAGDNFDSYTWYLDVNGNNQIDVGTDTVVTDTDSDNDPSTLLVTETGTYLVDKQVADPCKDFMEIITVELFGSVQSNPITALINDTSNTIDGDIIVCPNDGSETPEIFLCGLNDTELIQINVPDALSIVWEQLDEASCGAAVDGCANTDGSCTWDTVDTGNDFLATDSGQYRITLNYQNGCFTRFYFNVYKNPLDPQYTSRDIICNTDGNITVTNMPLSYEFQLVNQSTGAIITPYQSSPSFDISTNGAYMVEMRQAGVTGGCVFLLDNIGILQRDFQVDITTQNTNCTGLGEISISVLDVEPQYYYEISTGGTVVDTFGPSADNNYTFQNLNSGVYDVAVTTDDGCTYNEQVTILDEADLELTARISQHITCREGNIQMESTGGKTPHLYAIWSFVDEDGITQISYPSVTDVPASEFQTSQIFDIYDPGQYTFVVVDRYDCYDISNTVTIEFRPAADFNATTVLDVLCNGDATGSITFNLVNSNGYQLTYYLFDATGFDEDNYDYADALSTNASGNFPALGDGDYVVVINQRKGSASCDYFEYHTVSAPGATIDGSAVLVQDYSCLSDGVVEIQNVTGGTAPYEYSIDGVNFVSSPTFNGLTDGTYSAVIRDANGCTFDTNPITIDPLVPPTDIDFAATNPLCPTFESDITLTVTGGSPSLTYEIISPAASAVNNGNNATFADLLPGTYMFRVTDSDGCFYDESYTIAPVTEISVIGQVVSNVTCYGDTDGEIAYTVSNFNTDYDYTVTGPASFSGTGETNGTISLTGLAEGTYTITVTDNLTNCTDTTDVTIAAPPAAITAPVTLAQPTCVADGSANIVANGGWGSYTYEITSGPAGYVLSGPQSSGLFSGLAIGGTYTYTVTDANGCVFTDTFILNEAVAPVLEIVPNDICYDDATGLTLTANITSGGDGNYEYSLNGGPFGTNNVFTNLGPGTYTVDVRDGNDCTDTASITIDPELSVVASAPNITACATDTDITITAAGGDGNYVYAVVANGATPNAGDFSTTNPITVTSAGDYDVYVRDNNGAAGYCEATYDITITQDDPLVISVTNTDILCSGESQAQITIAASGGEGPYLYSIDNGANYQTSNTFVNLPAGSYNVRVRDANNCQVTEIYTITEPLTLSASAAVTALAECYPGMGAEVRITNAIGGTAPYEYSFDGGSTYGASSIGYLLPGTHTLYIRDANLCTFPMSVTIDPEPEAPTATTSIDYECDGEGTITVTPSSTDFDYTYEIDGSPNTPNTSNVFTDVAVGNHTITVNYTSNIAPSPSILLSENFGTGPNTSIPEVDPAYCYEPQNGSANSCGWSINTEIQDGEYSVTQTIVNPYPSWLSPNDHTGVANGRFLAMNVGGAVGANGIIYAKRGIEVVPNRDITISLWAFNLLRNGTGGADPDIDIQLVDGVGTVIASTTTGNVPKNNGVNDWQNYSVTLNPGANTNLDIVIRTNSAVTGGNDIAIDDIEAYQTPEVCTESLTINVNVEDGNAFDGAITSYTDLTCNSANDGTITFEVENFDPATGYTYQVDGGVVSAAQFASPITVSGLAAGAHTINIVDLRDPACSVVLNQTLAQPDVLDVTAVVTNELTCTNGGATVTATTTGGTPAYQYQLEDTVGGVITTYQSSNVFTGLAAGDYVIRSRDTNLCEDTTPITIAPPATIAFTLTPTACYSGNNDGTIQVDVTSGNGNYQFSINGGAWITPTPTSATTYTFSSLTAGTYTIDVRDQYGCSIQDTVTIVDDLVANVEVVDVSSCADGSITVTASGGSPVLQYAFVPTTTDPTGSFSTTNVYTVSAGNEGTFDVYVRDNSATAPYCEYVETVTVNPAVPLTMVATPTDPYCHDGTGNILVDITSGIAPYTIEIVDLDNGGASNQTDTNVLASSRTYYNLMPGDYTINVTDATGCTITDTQTINNPDELTGIVTGVVPLNCDASVGPNDFGFDFSGYPSTIGTIEFSDDGGTTWQSSDQFRGYNPGDTVYPSLRTVDGSSNTVCQTDLEPFIIPYPLDDLDITISALIVNCNELQVTVQGSEGVAPYEYAYSDDPANFDPTAATWQVGGTTDNLGNTVPAGHGMYQWTGLVPGRTYVFYVRDTSGCVRQSNVNVNDLITVPLEITSVVTPTCDGLSTGSITYTITDNQAPFETQMRWTVYDMSSGSPVSVATSGGIVPFSSPQQDVTVNNLPEGNYYIEVTEVDGSNNDSCVGATENVFLPELNPLSGTLNVLQDISCSEPGLIQVQNPLGGGGTYTYTVTGPVGFTTITSTSDNPIEIPANSPAGNYDVTMEDQYGCGVNLGSVPLTLTPNPTIDSIVIDSCALPITVTINATSTAPQIFYSLDGGATYENNGGIFTNVAPGTYNVSIIDSNGCTDTDVIEVHPPLEFTAIQTVALDCEPGALANAEIEIEVFAGSGNYEYMIDGPGTNDQARAVLPSNPFTWTGAAAAGSYDVIVFDMGTAPPNCSRTITVEVPDAPLPSFTETHTDVTCFGASDGTITLTEIDNGINPLTYTLSPMPAGAVLNGNTFENLPAGTYSVRGVGSNSCFVDIFDIIIGEPAAIAVAAPTVVEFGCTAGNNTNNATITVDTASITGGSGNYVIYEFINDAGSVVVQSGSNPVYTETNTAGGNYTINVYDSNGCLGTTTAVIAPFDSLDSATVAVDAVATCVTGEDITITAIGSITTSVTDPANYEFRELPSGTFQASGSFTGLSVGIHNFEVRNTVTGCIITVSHEVADPEVLDLMVVSTTDITCYGDTNGAVELNLVDASSITYASAITYTLYYDINNTPTNLADDVTSTGSDTDGNFTISGLAAGTYYIEVTDTNPPGAACVYSESFNIAGPAAPITGSTVVTDITCVGNDGIIQITGVAGGWGGYSYYVGTTSPTGPGDYVASPNFTGLSVGTYEAWVIDSSGCEQLVDTVTLTDPLPITASLQVNVENCTNLQGEIEVVGTTGGQGSNYTYQLIRNGVNVGSPKTSTIFSGLGAGSYEVLIADQWTCTTTVGPVVLSDAMTANTTVVKPIDCTVDPGGQITVNVSGGSSNLTFDLVYPDGTTTDSNATGVFTGLVQPGVYTITVTDNDTTTPCTYVVTQELDDKVDPVIDNVIEEDVSCNGGSDGSLTVVLDPATVVDPVYTYELYQMSNLVTPYRFAQSSPVFDNLPAGDYRVRVISSRACEDTFDATIGEPPVLAATATATDFSCSPSNSVNEATVTVVPTGGTAPFVYSFNGNAFTSSTTFDVVDNGSVQTINYIVRDANGCEYPNSIDIQPLNTFTVATNQDVAISCVNPETVTLTVTEYIPGDTYTFALLPVGNTYGTMTASTGTTATFDLNAPGTYTFRATNDATGCYVITSYTIAPYDTIDVVATATSPAMCFGDAGEITIDVSGYPGLYDYDVYRTDGTLIVSGSGNASAGSLAISHPDLVGGNYYVEVEATEAPFCTSTSGTVTIISPSSALDAAPLEVANVTCTNDLGEIMVAPTGGYAPYDIVLTNTTTSEVYTMNDVQSFVFTGLSAGDYTVRVTDNGGCFEDRTLTLTEPDPITADIDAAPIDLACYGDDSAAVWAINVTGGEGSYAYQLNYYDATGTTIEFTTGEQTNNTFTGLGAGIYSITVTDGWNCGVETPQVTINEPTEVFASLVQVTEMTCTTDAEILLTASGGNGSYLYSTDNINFTPMAGNSITLAVGEGVYQYYVRDTNGCEAEISNQVTIDPIPELILTIDDSAAFINCMGEASATITAQATGGLGNYYYELFSDAALTNLLAGPQTSGTFNTLPAGSYYVRVISEDCVEVSPEIIIVDPAPLVIEREESTDITCAGMDDGTITVEVSGGTGEILYAISPNLDQFDTENTFTDLAPGIYDVIAQDVNGCFLTFQFEIVQPEPIAAEAINIMHEVCFDSADGEFEIQVTGGTAPYMTSLNSSQDANFVQDQFLFQNLAAGTHVVFIRDAQGCETNVIVEIEPGVNLAATVTPMYECTGNIPNNYLDIVFENESIIDDVMYAVDSTDPADMQLTADFSNLTPGDHFVTIAHANGCMTTYDFTIEGYEPLTLVLENNSFNQITAIAEGGVEDYTFYFNDINNGSDNIFYINYTDTYTVTVIDQNGCEATAEIYVEFMDVDFPDFFTPDGDGLNDFWLPDNVEGFPDVLIKIYDRYGRVVEEMTREIKGWDGNYDGKPLPTGDYWYVVRLNGDRDDREFVGHFTLYRN